MSTQPDHADEHRLTPEDEMTMAQTAPSLQASVESTEEPSVIGQLAPHPVTSHDEQELRRTHRWLIDSERSIVEFRARNFWGLLPVRGRFSRFDGSDDGETIELTVDAASLDTKHKKRDAHLRSADFFDVDHHPQLGFRSTSVTEQTEGVLRVVGELKVAGKTMPLSFDARIRADRDEMEIEVETSVDQRIFGMTWSPLGMVRSPAVLHVKARLVSEGVKQRGDRL